MLLRSFLLVGLFLLAYNAGARAESSWWERGSELLKSIGTPENSNPATVLTNTDIEEAFRQALQIGAENVITQIGVTDGFYADPEIRIPLPEKLDTVKSMLEKVGMESSVVDLEERLNRAAEKATPKARTLFIDAIQSMRFEDVRRIYEGRDDSATQYFRQSMTPSLKTEMKPIVDETLLQTGVLQTYDSVMGHYKALPFVPDISADLSEYAMQKGLDGLFFYLAREEAAIRNDPLKHSTAILQKVFSKP